MQLRRNFGSSRLVRLLAGWCPVDADGTGQDIAQRLGPWLGVREAVTLHATHHTIRSMHVAPAVPARKAVCPPVDDELQRVRAALVQAIQSSGAPVANRRHGRNAATQPDAGTATGVAFAPYRKRYADLQHHMELRVAALRAHVRAALSRATPALAQLAALDAAMDQMLAGRAQQLWSTVPVLLERRFEQLRRQRPQGDGGAQPQTARDLWIPQDEWLVVFGRELQDLLLAELDERMQPVAGLVDAFNNVFKKFP